MVDSKVKKSSLQQFIDKQGYTIVHKDESGNWRGIAEAKRITGLGEMTIRRILDAHPTEPHKGEAAYVSEFEQSQGYKFFFDKYGKKSNTPEKLRQIREAWLLLNKKDPISWTHDDYSKIWNSDRFFVKEFKGKEFMGVPEGYASTFHNLMRVTKKHELLNAFQGKKYPKGAKLEWYLEDNDLFGLCTAYTDNENLLITLLGINIGGRWSSLVLVKPQDLNFVTNTVLCYEPKRKEFVPRYVLPSVMQLLRRYIDEYKIQPTDLLFTQEYNFYLTKMKQAGKIAGIPKIVSTHILKHTFVTQAHRHGVSAEIIVEQTGTDWATLIKHYRAGDEKKARHEILGEKYDVQPFPDWLSALVPYFVSAYERIRKDEISKGVTVRNTIKQRNPT